MKAGPLALRPVTASMCRSSRSMTRPRGSKRVRAWASWASVTPCPAASTVMPRRMEQGVLGMARTRGVPAGMWAVRKSRVVPAAMETTRGWWSRAPEADRPASRPFSSFGFTQSSTTSACRTASAASLERAMPRVSARARAAAGCRVAAWMRPAG